MWYMRLQERLYQAPRRLVERGARTSVGWKGLDVSARFPRVGLPLYVLYRVLGSQGQK